MRSLIMFELKKIVSRRVTQVAVGGLFALLVLVFALNVLQQTAIDDAGERASGLAAIALEKERAEADAGIVTDEKATEDIRAFQRFFNDEGEIDERFASEDFADPESAHAYMTKRYAYLDTILRPWMNGSQPIDAVAPRVDASQTVALYDQVAASMQAKLAESASPWAYSEAEQEFWMQKHADAPKPVEYGYAGGWGDILACVNFLFFAIVAACVAAAPVFAAEYQEKTDAVVLATRHGKGKLVAAKIAASLLFATAVFALYAVVAVGVPLAFFGAEGAGLPLQGSRLSIPYDVTMAQAVGVCIGVAYLVTLGMTALALLLSAKLRSPLGIFAICVAVILLPMFLPTMPSGLANHLLYLLPINAIDYANLFANFVSYRLGPVVLDMQAVVVAAYVVLMALAIPLAARAFRRHQVL